MVEVGKKYRITIVSGWTNGKPHKILLYRKAEVVNYEDGGYVVYGKLYNENGFDFFYESQIRDNQVIFQEVV